MLNLNFTTKFRKAERQIQRELDELENAYWDWKDLSEQYETVHSSLTVEALDWLLIDPNSDATHNYVSSIVEELEDLEVAWADVETRILFAQDLGSMLVN